MRHGFLLAAWLFSLPCWGWSESATTDRDRPLFHALEALGVKYRYGGRSPETGFDCSGLIRHVFERAWGMLLPAGIYLGGGRCLRAPRPGASVRMIMILIDNDNETSYHLFNILTYGLT